MNVKDKVVIITGGGRGIGFGISAAYAKAGAKLVITGRTESTLLEAKEKLEAYGTSVLTVTADGADEAAIKNVIAKTVETYGKIDVVVNNAQASKSGKMLVDHTKKISSSAIYSGLYATFFYMREAFPYLKETKGASSISLPAPGACGQARPILLSGGKRGNPRPFESRRHRVGTLRRPRQRHLPARHDRGLAEV